VDGNGTAAVGSNYSWIDTDVINGRTYEYELVSVEVGGSRHSLVSESVTPSATSGLVAEYALHQNFPNPFNPETSIAFALAEAGDISLKVYNLTGQVIATVASGSHDAGRHVVNFDGSSLSAGVYFYALETGNFSAARKLVLLK